MSVLRTILLKRKSLWLLLTIAFSLLTSSRDSYASFAEVKQRQVSDYKSFAELCLDRENLPKATRESIELLLLPRLGYNNAVIETSCEEIGKKLSTNSSSIDGIVDLKLTDLNLLRFAPNVESLMIDGDKVVSDFSILESLEKLQKLSLSISSLDKLGNIKLKHLRVLYLAITGDRIASDVNVFKRMPKFAEFSADNDTNYSPRSEAILTLRTPSGLIYLPHSVTLLLSGDNLTNISALKSAKGLVILELQGQKISDISSLRTLTHLKSLIVCSTRVSNFSPLQSLVNLGSLGLRRNRIIYLSQMGSLSQKIYDANRECG